MENISISATFYTPKVLMNNSEWTQKLNFRIPYAIQLKPKVIFTIPSHLDFVKTQMNFLKSESKRIQQKIPM